MLAKPLVWLMRESNRVTRNYGLDIIFITVLIKILFYPLTKKSLASMRKMQELGPIINKLKEKQLAGLGIKFPMPWLLSEFGNVSAASNMIAFLRKLSELKPGDHVLIDGFGAGTYYDTLAVELGG